MGLVPELCDNCTSDQPLEVSSTSSSNNTHDESMSCAAEATSVRTGSTNATSNCTSSETLAPVSEERYDNVEQRDVSVDLNFTNNRLPESSTRCIINNNEKPFRFEETDYEADKAAKLSSGISSTASDNFPVLQNVLSPSNVQKGDEVLMPNTETNLYASSVRHQNTFAYSCLSITNSRSRKQYLPGVSNSSATNNSYYCSSFNDTYGKPTVSTSTAPCSTLLDFPVVFPSTLPGLKQSFPGPTYATPFPVVPTSSHFPLGNSSSAQPQQPHSYSFNVDCGTATSESSVALEDYLSKYNNNNVSLTPPTSSFNAAAELIGEVGLNQILSDSARNRPMERRSLASSASEKVQVLQQQLDKVQRQLNVLQSRYNDMFCKYERARAEVDSKEEALHNVDYQLQAAKSEISAFESDREFANQQKMLMQQQMRELELRLERAEIDAVESCQRYQVLLDNGFNHSAALALDSYDNLRREKERLQQEVEVLESRYSIAQEELSVYRDDVCLLKRQLEQEAQEKHNVLRLERESSQTLVAVYSDLQRASQEKENAVRKFDVIQQRLDEAQFEINRLMGVNTENEIEIRRLRNDRDAVLAEHSMMMSERDSVLKENERLTEENLLLLDKAGLLEKQQKLLSEELGRIKSHVNAGQAGVLSEYASYNNQSSLNQPHTQSYETDSTFVSASSPSISRVDEVVDQLEALKFDADKLRGDRDWAMQERERIVAERDSLRIMADQLRKERDDTITRLGNALRDLDDFKRQRDRLEAEIKEIRDKMEVDSSFANSIHDPSSPSHSRDSAIDADMAEWEIETLELKMTGCNKGDLGLQLGGGPDDLVLGSVLPIYVKTIVSGSKFDGHLRVYDALLSVNNIDVSQMERRSVIDILKNSTQCKMIIKRRNLVGMKLISVPLNLAGETDLGLSFEDGVYISKIKISSAAAKAGNIVVGDRVVYVNNVPVSSKCAADVRDLIRECSNSGNVVLAVMKSPPLMSPITPTNRFPFTAAPNEESMSRLLSLERKTCLKDASVQVSATVSNSLTSFDSTCNSASEKTFGNATTGYSNSTPTAPTVQQNSSSSLSKKHDSIFDKIHDKLFDRNRERKVNVKALATIPISSGEQFWRGPVNRSWTKQQGRPTSLYSGSPVLSSHFITTQCQVIPEAEHEAALAELDQVIQGHDSDTLTPRRAQAFCKLQHQEQQQLSAEEKMSGGTWPKYRAQPLMVNQEKSHPVVPPDCSTSPQILRPEPKGKSRKPIKSVFGEYELVRSQPGTPSHSQNRRNNAQQHCRSPSRPQTISANSVSRVVYATPHFVKGSKQQPEPQSVVYRQHSYSPLIVRNSAMLSPFTDAGYCPQPAAETMKYVAPSMSQDSSHSFMNSSVCGRNTDDLFSSGTIRSKSSRSNSRRLTSSVYENYGDLQQRGVYNSHCNSPGPGAKADVEKENTKAQIVHAKPSNVAAVSQAERNQTTASCCTPPSHSSASFCSTGLSTYPDDFYMNVVYSNMSNRNNTSGSLSSFSSTHSATSSSKELIAQRYPPSDIRPGLMRRVRICRSSHEALGITIDCKGRGIFVVSVVPSSLASRHGIYPGDQILEVGGISFRHLNNVQMANRFLSELTQQEEIIIDLEYNPEKLRNPDSNVNTPRASPCPCNERQFMMSRHSSDNSTQHSRELLQPLRTFAPRAVFISKSASDWGLNLIGGNAHGIFVNELKFNTSDGDSAGVTGLQRGDQLLEFNGIDFRKLTMEQAREELQRPCDGDVTVLAQYNEKQYEKCRRALHPGGGGDSLYVRALFERLVDSRDEMSFRAGDILYIDNTAFNNQCGLWRAWLVDEQGRHRSCGVVPSKIRLEEEYFAKRGTLEFGCGDASSDGSGSRRGTIRRSLKAVFGDVKRRSSRSSQHNRTASHDSQETTTTETLVLDMPAFYQRVDRIDYVKKRPVLILGPLADYFSEKLQEEFSQLFKRCVPETLPSMMNLEQGLNNGHYVDYRRREKLFEVTTVAAVREIMEQGYHCILEVSAGALESMHRMQIYPVVIFLKFKHAKQIKEIKEAAKITDYVINSKQAKELFEEAGKTEHDYHHCFTESIQIQSQNYGVKYLCQQMQCIVEHEQKKTLWVISKEQL